MMGGRGLDSSGSGYEQEVFSYEHDNEFRVPCRSGYLAEIPFVY
jgi:hypothetical protein